jgi:hypothetical protein
MELTLADFVSLTLFGSFALVLIFSLISRVHRLRSESRALARRVVCRLCLHAFEDASRDSIVSCPHCGAANEKGRTRRLG